MADPREPKPASDELAPTETPRVLVMCRECRLIWGAQHIRRACDRCGSSDVDMKDIIEKRIEEYDAGYAARRAPWSLEYVGASESDAVANIAPPPPERAAQTGTLSREEIEQVRGLLDDADDALDKDTYEQKRQADFDAPDDAEWSIRAGTERKIARAFTALYKVLRALDQGQPTTDTITVDRAEFDRIVADLANPGPPTEVCRRGAEMLRQLRRLSPAQAEEIRREPALRVDVGEMRETGDRLSYYVTLYRAGDTIFDGMSLERCPTRAGAEEEAQKWREFFAPVLALLSAAERAQPVGDEEVQKRVEELRYRAGRVSDADLAVFLACIALFIERLSRDLQEAERAAKRYREHSNLADAAAKESAERAEAAEARLSEVDTVIARCFYLLNGRAWINSVLAPDKFEEIEAIVTAALERHASRHPTEAETK